MIQRRIMSRNIRIRMLLKDVLANLDNVTWPREKGQRDICRISCDSREDQSGALFVGLSGFKSKGVDFVGDVVAKGAVVQRINDGGAVNRLGAVNRIG